MMWSMLTLMLGVYKSELVWPSYIVCKSRSFFMKCVFCTKFYTENLVCAIMPGFRKSGHK